MVSRPSGEGAASGDPEPRPELGTRYSGPDDPDAVDAGPRRLEHAELFWIATVRDDGRPHVTLPAVWLDGALHFCTGAEEQKGVNLDRNPSCTLTTGNNAWEAGLDVVVEEAAPHRVVDDEQLRQLAAL